MKVLLIILGSLGLVFLIFQIYLYVSTAKVENRPYDVVKNKGELEIRFYPKVKMAQYTSQSGQYKTASSNGFRKLAGYIFGKNEKSESIAMTSPVQMDMDGKETTMSFMMPSVYDSTELPTPKDSSVKLVESNEEYVAAIGFSGFASDELIEKYTKELKDLLIENNLTATSNYRYLGYNPPYQLLGRKNEVVVQVTWEMQ